MRKTVKWNGKKVDVETDTITITQEMDEEAFVHLEKADKSKKYAKQLKAHIEKQMQLDHADNLCHTIRGSLIPYALLQPGGRVERLLRKCGLLEPKFLEGYDFSQGSH